MLFIKKYVALSQKTMTFLFFKRFPSLYFVCMEIILIYIPKLRGGCGDSRRYAIFLALISPRNIW